MDWFDLLAVQGTLKSLLQLHSSKASILRKGGLTQKFKRAPIFVVMSMALFSNQGSTVWLNVAVLTGIKLHSGWEKPLGQKLKDTRGRSRECESYSELDKFQMQRDVLYNLKLTSRQTETVKENRAP